MSIPISMAQTVLSVLTRKLIQSVCVLCCGNLQLEITNQALADTPACISVYTPSNTGPLTPSIVQSPPDQVMNYAGEDSQLWLVSKVQNTSNRPDNVQGHTPNPPSILRNPKLFSESRALRQETTYNFSTAANPVNQQNVSLFPASVSPEIVPPSGRTFTGQSPQIPHISVIPLPTSEALQPHTQALIPPATDPTVSAMADQAMGVPKQSRYAQADEDRLREELFLTETMFGKPHFEYLEKAIEIGHVLKAQGRYKSAEDMIRQSLLYYRKDNKDDVHTIKALNLLGQITISQGLYSQAEKLLVKALHAAQQLLGPEHMETLDSMANLAANFYYQERLKEAEELEVQVLEKYESILGHDHHVTLQARTGLAITYNKQRRYKDTEDLTLPTMATQKTVFGQEHPNTLDSMHILAGIYYDTNRLDEAQDLAMQVLQTRIKVVGKEHPDTLASMYLLACIWRAYGRHGESLELITQCFDMRTRVLGADHPATRRSRNVMLKSQEET